VTPPQEPPSPGAPRDRSPTPRRGRTGARTIPGPRPGAPKTAKRQGTDFGARAEEIWAARRVEAAGTRASPPDPAAGGRARKDPALRASTTHRGVRWQRNSYGRLRWYNDDGQRWVLWRPGQDAPPLPPGWGSGSGPLGTPLRDRRARAKWRSPYRLVPVGLAVLILALGVVQAVRERPSPTKAEAAAAEKLLGKCLESNGTFDGKPRYEASPVSCTSPHATVKVISVLPGTPGAPNCPAGATAVRLAYPDVKYLHRECVKPVRH
jgi:hypothetical protein